VDLVYALLQTANPYDSEMAKPSKDADEGRPLREFVCVLVPTHSGVVSSSSGGDDSAMSRHRFYLSPLQLKHALDEKAILQVAELHSGPFRMICTQASDDAASSTADGRENDFFDRDEDGDNDGDGIEPPEHDTCDVASSTAEGRENDEPERDDDGDDGEFSDLEQDTYVDERTARRRPYTTTALGRALARARLYLGQDPSLRRQLVFDLDLDSYDASGIRAEVCNCTGKSACDSCFELVRMSASILRRLLSYKFGYTFVLAVFSGRRGIHVSVYDPAAWVLPAAAREALIRILALRPRDWTELMRNQRASSHSPMLKLAFKEVLPHFVARFISPITAKDGGILATDAKCEAALRACDLSLPLCAMLMESVRSSRPRTGECRWNVLFRTVTMLQQQDPGLYYADLERFLLRFVLERIWPRVDVPVTTEPTHASRAPFSVHASTGNLATPLHDRETRLKTPPSSYQFSASRAPSVYTLNTPEGTRALDAALAAGRSLLDRLQRKHGAKPTPSASKLNVV